MKWAKGHPAFNIHRDHGICVLEIGDQFFSEAFPHCCEGCLKFSNPRFRSLWVARCQRLRPRAESIFLYLLYFLPRYLTKIRWLLCLPAALDFGAGWNLWKSKCTSYLTCTLCFLSLRAVHGCPWHDFLCIPWLSQAEKGSFPMSSWSGDDLWCIYRWKKQCVLRNGLLHGMFDKWPLHERPH